MKYGATHADQVRIRAMTEAGVSPEEIAIELQLRTETVIKFLPVKPAEKPEAKKKTAKAADEKAPWEGSHEPLE